MTSGRLTPHRARAPRRERGIVVFVALIAVVLLSLAAVALMRSVHTSTMVVGNLAFRQAAQVLSAAAVERAVFDMFPPSAVIADLTVHDTARNYYASIQPNQDRNGVPRALQGDPAVNYAPLGAQVITDSPTGNVARYIIERMCDDDAIGIPTTALTLLQKDCEMIPPKQGQGMESGGRQGLIFPKILYYRVTVRVDGPGNSVAYSQAMIR